MKNSYENNKFNISSTTWNEKFDLPDGLCSLSDIQDSLKYIIKKHETLTNNPSIIIYVNRQRIGLHLKSKEDITSGF